MRRALGLAVVLAVALCATASADVLSDPTLTLDTYFAPPSGIARTDFTAGATSSPHASATDTSLNRIYSVGETGSGTSGNVAIVARHPDGTSDTSFGVNGQVVVSVSSSVEDYGIDLLVLPDHHLRILVKTGTGSTTDGALVGLLPDGTADTAFGAGVNTVNSASLNGIVTFEGAFQAAYPGQLSNLTPETPNAFALAPDGRLAVTGDSAHGGTDDNTFVAMFNADGSLATGFGTRGTLVQDRSGNASADQGADIAFRPAGGIVVLVQLGPTTSAASALHAYTVAGADDPSFANGGDLALAVGDPPTIPAALLVYNGQLWVTGSTRTAADTNAFIARAGADGSGLQSRQFDMRGQLVDPAQAVTSQGDALVIAPAYNGTPRTLVVVGSVTSASATDWAAAAFNDIDGDVAAAGFGDIGIPAPGSGPLVSVAAGGDGAVSITGPYQETVTTPSSSITYTRFGDARLLIDADKACNLNLRVSDPLELTVAPGVLGSVSLAVANGGTRTCGGSISVPGP
ncbi:MAG: hypothetical protein JWO02_1681, partial [Solirubrobacterales bacterium]|nr:hypothetical protein [Solirubrobacterales bacterium]